MVVHMGVSQKEGDLSGPRISLVVFGGSILVSTTII